ncbi:MAG: DUF1295 domain-containing protein [Bacilli bacterium]|nr:DUF1295 domain-containing protein [Bacilli bacterium]
MRKIALTALTAVIAIASGVVGVLTGFELTPLQEKTLGVLILICAIAALYCFVVGEIARNNSQMDKLWSILPIAYSWVIAAMGGMKIRLVVIAVLVTLWGIRLTFNFARKGAYSIRFWEGEEDYRWAILRAKKPFDNKIVWAAFDLFFISIYQNFLVLLICLPALAVMESSAAFGLFDFVAAALAAAFLLIEFVADEQQWSFQTKKHAMLKEGKALNELPAPFDLGFNTIGLWGHMRHPNYLGEQGFWISIYLFVIAGGVASFGVFNWTIVAPALLVLLFLGSSTLGENISGSKYPLYAEYCRSVPKYIYWKKFSRKDEKQ